MAPAADAFCFVEGKKRDTTSVQRIIAEAGPHVALPAAPSNPLKLPSQPERLCLHALPVQVQAC